MARARDTQRSRVYSAERKVFGISGRMTLQECQAYADRIVNSRWWRSRKPYCVSVEVRDGRGRRKATGYVVPAEEWGWDTAIVKLPVWARTNWVLLHELAHCLSDDGKNAHHGPLFCKNFLALVDRWIGKEIGKELRATFKERGVKYRASRS